MRIRVVSLDQIHRCSRKSLRGSHYRDDGGPCRCVDTEASLAAKQELDAALADLRAARQRVKEARTKAAET